MNKQEIILNADGSAVIRSIDERPCKVVDNIAAAMAETAVRYAINVAMVDGIPMSLVLSNKEIYAVMMLPCLTITAPWMVNNGILQPRFTDADGNNPTLPLKWPAQPGMRIMFAARIYKIPSLGYRTQAKESCFLLALDNALKSFMLPLPNIYGSGYMCMGDFDGSAATIQEAMQKAYTQLHQSKWNADLLTDGRTRAANKMVTFKPDGEKFIPQAYAGWAAELQRCEGAVIETLKGVLR
jgi:hypothetical protein